MNMLTKTFSWSGAHYCTVFTRMDRRSTIECRFFYDNLYIEMKTRDLKLNVIKTTHLH